MTKSILWKGEQRSPKEIAKRDVYIFYNSGRIKIQALNTLGEKPGLNGYFSVNERFQVLAIDFDQAGKVEFHLDSLSQKLVRLNANDTLIVDLIPFPEI